MLQGLDKRLGGLSSFPDRIDPEILSIVFPSLIFVESDIMKDENEK